VLDPAHAATRVEPSPKYPKPVSVVIISGFSGSTIRTPRRWM
jgi:hypothetical protein